MKWFDKWFYKQSKKAWESQSCNSTPSVDARSIPNVPTHGRPTPSNIGVEGLNMQVARATGGYIIQFNRYDGLNDVNNSNLYIINDEDDFDTKISSIIKLEMFKLPH